MLCLVLLCWMSLCWLTRHLFRNPIIFPKIFFKRDSLFGNHFWLGIQWNDLAYYESEGFQLDLKEIKRFWTSCSNLANFLQVTTILRTTYKLLANFLHTSHFMNFLQNSCKVLKKFLQASYVLLTNFLQASNRPLKNVL